MRSIPTRVVVAVVTVSLTACTAAPGAPQPPPTSAGPAPASTAVCPPSASASGLSDGEGVGHGMTVWALPFPTESTYRHGRELKVVWRITGTGEPAFTASGPGEASIRPVWGPEPHSGSSWQRPGDEYGTGWNFPTAGCWTIHINRDDARGEYVFRIA